MPLQRRLPKRGFKSALLKYNAEITLADLERLDLNEVDILILKKTKLIPEMTKVVKVIKTGQLTKKIKLTGIHVTAGAKAVIEAVGGVCL
jgi:large subunit ribosomal protein L15